MGRGYEDVVHHRAQLSAIACALRDSAALRHLRGKFQLGVTRFVYDSATHTRYEHSIGVGITAGLIADACGLTARDRAVVEAAALLHDIGHRASSHVTDDIVSLKHEDVAVEVLTTGEDYGAINGKELWRILDEHSINPSEVARMLLGQHRLSNIVANEVIDADRLDYLDRDLYKTGVGPRIDAAKIRESFYHDGTNLGIRSSGVDSLIQALATRAWAYKRIYHHPDSARAIAMTQLAIHSDERFQGMSNSAEEALHAIADIEFFSTMAKSTSPDVRAIVERLHGPREKWFPTIYSLEDSGPMSRATIGHLYSKKEDIEQSCRDRGFAIYWFRTAKRLRQLACEEYPFFPIKEGGDVFMDPAARVNYSDYPRPWIAIYGKTGDSGEKREARKIIESA